jgi:hypothetical protein
VNRPEGESKGAEQRVFANQSESDAMPEVDDLDDLDDFEAAVEADEPALELYDGDEELENADALLAAGAEDDVAEESSLDELLARRAAKTAREEVGPTDLVTLLDDVPDGHEVASPSKRPEFVCARCRLVKPRVQLSDAARCLCRDCA